MRASPDPAKPMNGPTSARKRGIAPSPGPRPGTGVGPSTSGICAKASGVARKPASRRSNTLFLQTSKASGSAGAVGVCGTRAAQLAAGRVVDHLLQADGTARAARSASSGRMCASPISTIESLLPVQVKTSSPASL